MFSTGESLFREAARLEMDDDWGGDIVVDGVEDFAELVEVLDHRVLVVELEARNENLGRTAIDGSDAGAYKNIHFLFIQVLCEDGFLKKSLTSYSKFKASLLLKIQLQHTQ